MALSTETAAKIQELLSKAEGGSLVQSMASLHEFLISQGLAFRQRLSCRHIGVHQCNRDGLGCNAQHVHQLLSDVVALGFVVSECKGICIEVPPDEPGEITRDFNRRLIAQAGGKLAQGEDVIRYASIVGSHTNQAFRCVLHRVPHADEALTVDGLLNMDKVRAADSALAAAIDTGIEWLVISHSIQKTFPVYAVLAQAAGNATSQVSKQEDELQVAKKILRAIDSHISKTGQSSVEYKDVSREVLRSRPPHPENIPHIFKFVLQCSGGSGPASFLLQTEAYVRAHGHASRVLGGEAWDALCTPCKGQAQRVVFRHALLKAAFSRATEKPVTVNDLRKALSNKDILRKADELETMVKTCKALLRTEAAECGEENLLMWLGQLGLTWLPWCWTRRSSSVTAPWKRHATMRFSWRRRFCKRRSSLRGRLVRCRTRKTSTAPPPPSAVALLTFAVPDPGP